MARCNEASKKMKTNKAHATGMRLIKAANQSTSMDIDSDGNTQHVSSQRLPVDVDEEFHQTNGSGRVESVFATRTRPVMNKY